MILKKRGRKKENVSLPLPMELNSTLKPSLFKTHWWFIMSKPNIYLMATDKTSYLGQNFSREEFVTSFEGFGGGGGTCISQKGLDFWDNAAQIEKEKSYNLWQNMS